METNLRVFLGFFSPPNGCLQYHTGIDGRFSTFNYGAAAAQDQHLRNQNYRICIRQEEGKAKKTWSQPNKNDKFVLL